MCHDLLLCDFIKSAKLVKKKLQSGFFLFCVIVQIACFHSESLGEQYFSVPEMSASRITAVLDSLVRTTYVQPDRFYSERSAESGNFFPKEFIPQFTDSVYVSR
ncbi:MAG TPA: lytic transglycosylase, partial [Chlorobaculum parvum]|nr:lytic transglycosylase [Chlorobaculum parvum]